MMDSEIVTSEDDILECSCIEDERSRLSYAIVDLVNLVTPKKQRSTKWELCSSMKVASGCPPLKETAIPVISMDENLETSAELHHSSKNAKNEFQSVPINEDSHCSCSDETLGSNTKSLNQSGSEYKEILNLCKGNNVRDLSLRIKLEPVKSPLKEINTDTGILNSSKIRLKERHCAQKECNDKEDNEDNSDQKQLSFISSLSDRTFGLRCDPVATFFKIHFRTAKSRLARHLYYIYNEVVFDHQLPVALPIKWSNKLLAACGITTTKLERDNQGNKTFTAYITLSKKIITTAERLRDTLIHEMCHAAVWLVNKSPDSHGPMWKLWALKARVCFPELPEVARCHTYEINYKYVYKCSDCGYCIGRSRPSEKLLKRCTCGYCGGRFKLKHTPINES